MRPILVVKAGSAPPELVARSGDFEDWIADRLAPGAREVRTVDVAAGAALPPPEAVAGVVVTGSSAMVSDRLPWSEAAGAWLADAVRSDVPVLGICYGHQLIARALGGRVGPNPRGREIGTIRVALDPAAREDRLFAASPPVLTVQATHRESVLAPPPGAVVLGRNALDDHHALRFAERAWGVQFHPEFDAEASRGYLTLRRADLIAEGLPADALCAAVADAPDGAALLRRFGGIVDEADGGGRVP